MNKYKIWQIISIFFVTLSIACEPINDRKSMGELYSESQINIDVHPITEGSNKIILNNNMPNVGGLWDYGVNKSTRKNDTIVMPFLGKDTIYFYATTPGGVVKVSRIVNITKIDYSPSPEYVHLAGTSAEGKTWVWATDYPIDDLGKSPFYGNGKYLYHTLPGYWHCPLSLMKTWGIDKDSMIFDLNGKGNITLITHNTLTETTNNRCGLLKGIYHGTFSLNMLITKNSVLNPSKLWSIGQITFTDATISCGVFSNDAGDAGTLVYTYDIIRLDDNVMVLACTNNVVNSDGVIIAWYWVFKRAGYVFS